MFVPNVGKDTQAGASKPKLERLRLVRLSLVAESSAGEKIVEREIEGGDAFTFFRPDTVYHAEFIAEVDTVKPLAEIVLETEDGKAVTLTEALQQALAQVDKERMAQ